MWERETACLLPAVGVVVEHEARSDNAIHLSVWQTGDDGDDDDGDADIHLPSRWLEGDGLPDDDDDEAQRPEAEGRSIDYATSRSPSPIVRAVMALRQRLNNMVNTTAQHMATLGT